jgi:hypothetical protein
VHDLAFGEFLLQLMEALGYGLQELDTAEQQFMSMTQKASVEVGMMAVLGGSNGSSAASGGAAAAAAAAATAAQQGLHAFKTGLLRRHQQVAAAAAGAQGGGQMTAGAAVQRLKAWVEVNMLLHGAHGAH